MAHTKSLGSTKLGRDSAAQRLGVKVNHNEPISAGEIIIRQRGSKYLAGVNVRVGKDDTLYAATAGTVQYKTKHKICFDGSRRSAKMVSVVAK